MTQSTEGQGALAIYEAKSFIPLLAVQQRARGFGYDMPVHQHGSAAEATAASHAARMRLRNGPIALAAPRYTLEIQQKPMETLPEPVVEPEDGPRDGVPLDMLKPCSWRFLVALVAIRHGQTSKDILGPWRTRPVVKARHEAVYLVTLHTAFSIAKIGMLFNRDHTTLLSSLKKFPRIQRTRTSLSGFSHD